MSFNDDTSLEQAQYVRWHEFANASSLQQAAYQWIVDAAHHAITAGRKFNIVLAGGSTPRAVYTLLRNADTDWSRWQIWFGDERCLPVGDPQRNSTMAFDTWLAHVPIPPSQVNTIPAQLGADVAAAMYAQVLHEKQCSDFDLVLLGLGEDGHTASLFPGNDLGITANSPDTIAVVNSPKPPAHRVSLNARRLSKARKVLFLVEGESKRDAVTRWRAGEDIPARAIRPNHGVDVLITQSPLLLP